MKATKKFENLSMPETIIVSYFENNGIPATNLTPEIRIWEIEANSNNLVIGDEHGYADPGVAGGGQILTGSNGVNGIMIEVYDNAIHSVNLGVGPAGSRDGLYRYVFHTDNGFDPKKNYIFRVDGGATLSDQGRYQVGELTVAQNADALVDLIYEEPTDEHITTGSVGGLLNETKDMLGTLMLSVENVQALVELAVKYQANKTKVDSNAMTLTIYDVDCITPLRTFRLLDSNGNPSITEICERIPVLASDGLPVCDQVKPSDATVPPASGTAP